MDILEFILALVSLALVGVLVMRYLGMKDAANRYKAQKEAKISAQNRLNAQQRGNHSNAPSGADVLGEWVPELLDNLGLDPALLFEDEMPEELVKFLPMIKGFVEKSGGIRGLMAKFGGGGAPAEEFKGL